MGVPSKVLILGLDGANPDLLLGWAREGLLPNLASLVDRGRYGKTRGLQGFFIGSTWPSIHTGLTPANHGFHYLAQIRAGSYEYYDPAESGLYSGKPFWKVLGDAGKRIAILDAPLSALDTSINGMQIVEWGGHDSIYGFSAHPGSLADLVRKEFGTHPSGINCDGSRRSACDYEQFVDRLLKGVSIKCDMTRQFLSRGEWDLFMQVFSESHCVGHQCWHLHETSHPCHDSGIAEAVGDPVLRVYQGIDSAIGKILEDAGDCRIYVFSSHGMSHWYGANFLLQEILVRLGVTQPRLAPVKPGGKRSPVLAAGQWAWIRIPRALRAKLAGVRRRFGSASEQEDSAPLSIDADPATSRCFQHRNGLAVAGIRLNLIGREPLGTVRPGQEADAFCQSLASDLFEVVNKRTGRPLVKRVIRVSQYYQGTRLGELPDLLVEYDDTIPTGSAGLGSRDSATIVVTSPKIGVLEGVNTYGRSGEHRPDGLLIASGPGISAGTFEQPPAVVDLAPTWASSLGVELENADGKPIAGVSVPV